MDDRGPYLVGGNPDDVAQALMDGKPVSDELGGLYARVLRRHIAGLATKHLQPDPEPEPPPSAVVLPFPSADTIRPTSKGD